MKKHEVQMTMVSNDDSDDVRVHINLGEAFDEDAASHRMVRAIVGFIHQNGTNFEFEALPGSVGQTLQ